MFQTCRAPSVRTMSKDTDFPQAASVITHNLDLLAQCTIRCTNNNTQQGFIRFAVHSPLDCINNIGDSMIMQGYHESRKLSNITTSHGPSTDLREVQRPVSRHRLPRLNGAWGARKFCCFHYKPSKWLPNEAHWRSAAPLHH